VTKGGKVTRALVEACLAYASTDAPEHSWAFDAVVKLIRDSARDGLSIIQELLSRPLEPKVLFYVAAGPLEDLLARHGREVIDQVLDLARRDPQARKALLQGVWGRNRIPRDVQAKLAAFAERMRPR
jgi:hypothetical protein